MGPQTRPQRQYEALPGASAALLNAPEDYEQRREPDREEGLVAEYLRTLHRRRGLVLAFALAGCLLGLLLNMRTLPVYRSRTSLDIQKLNSDFMGMGTTAPVGDGQGGSGETYVLTQIKLLQSDSLLEHTLQKLRDEPHPLAIERQDFFSRIKRMLHAGAPAPIPYEAMLQDAAQRIKVKPLGLTRLVEVTCDSWNPEFSAKVCNTLTDTFREEDYSTRGAEAAKTSDWLMHQMADLRQQVQDAQERLKEATGNNGLVVSEQSTTVAEDRLRQIQEEYVKAEADRIDKQTQWEQSRSANPSSLETVLDDPNIRELQSRLNDLRGKVADLVPPLTEANPKVIQLRSQIAEAQSELSQQRASILDRVHNDYLAAKQHEDLLNVSYQLQMQNTSNELNQANKVDLLRKDFESEQQLYQTLLQRAKEAGFASAMQVSTVRIVDPAKAPVFAISPQRIRTMFITMFLGALAGIALAFYRERTSGVVHMPGELQELLHVQELGVIPNSNRPRRVLPHRQAARHRLESTAPISLDANIVEAPPFSNGGISIWSERHSVVAEAYRNTTFSILLAGRLNESARTYVISSPNAGEGKTTVVSNLGIALSQSKRRVVLVDGDLRKPGLHTTFGLNNTAGLRDLLRGSIDPTSAALASFCQPTAIPNLSVVAAGTGREEAAELLHSPRAAEVLSRLSSEFDLVLIDTPPMLHMADARIFADHADGAILVFRAGVTKREQAAAARDVFAHDRKRLLGIILNGFNPGNAGRSDYYNSYFRYKEAAEWVEQTPAGV